MIDGLALGAGLVVLAGVAITAVDALIKRADAGVALILGVTVLDAAFGLNLPSLWIGTTKVNLPDVVFTLVLAAAIARLLRAQRLTPLQRGLLAFGALVLVSLLRGVAVFGVEGSVSEARRYLRLAGGALYLASFPPSQWLNDRIGRIWLAMAAPMMLLVCLRWGEMFAGLQLGPMSDPNGAAIRAINGDHTFFLAEAFLLTVPAWRAQRDGTRRLRQLSALLLLFVVLLNRRTIWLALVVSVVVLVLRDRTLGRRALVLLACSAAVAAGVLVSLPQAAADGERPLARGVTETANLEWRIAGWRELIKSGPERPSGWVFGQPFGGGYARQFGARELETNPHSFYLETVLRTGLAGVVVFILLSGAALRAVWSTAPPSGGLLGPDILPAMLAMQLVWLVTWAPGMEQGLVTGLAVAWAAAGLRCHGTVRAASAIQLAEERPVYVFENCGCDPWAKRSGARFRWPGMGDSPSPWPPKPLQR